eukprot:s368_g22.t1
MGALAALSPCFVQACLRGLLDFLHAKLSWTSMPGFSVIRLLDFPETALGCMGEAPASLIFRRNWQLSLRQAFIDATANSKFGSTVSKQKKDKRPSKHLDANPVGLDPSTLHLDAALFIDTDGDSVPQIPLAQVVADGRGIASATLTEAMPYLQVIPC